MDVASASAASAASHHGITSLIRAMAPWEDVLSAACKEDWHSEAGQERFAQQVQSAWDHQAVSNRYLRNLVNKFVSKLELQTQVESDSLAMLVFTASARGVPPPGPEENCQISFDLRPYLANYCETQTATPEDVQDDEHLLRIRIYPYHNDVALRLWEAGARLAEFFVANPQRCEGRKVIELGTGVGLTGLVMSGCCGAKSVHMTDYTDACRLNLEYNIDLNREWVERMRRATNASEGAKVSQGYLEWSSFSKADFSVGSDADDGMRRFLDANLLIAADVVYDISVVEDLVMVIRRFLEAPTEDPSKERQAIMAMTKRNQNSFDLFLKILETHGVQCEWIAKGADCESFPLIFPTKFNQPRCDISVGLLSSRNG